MKTLFRFALPLLAFAAASVSAAEKKIVVGFAQTGAESAWRVANTESIKSEAAKRGVELKFADGEGKSEKQIQAVRSFVAQKVDLIILAPIKTAGWDVILRDAKRANIPVIVMDRKVQVADESLYTAFIGSDFYTEGKMAADWLAKNAGPRRKIVELQGTPGSDPANERRKAFAEAMSKHEGFKIIASQSGDFARSKGKEVMAALLKTHGKEIEIVYAHNDDMALGAVQAIEEAGLKPGTDIMIVTIDALKEAIAAVAAGKLNCTVECNPLFGPKIFDAVEKVLKGEKIPREMYNKDELFDATNAAAALPSRKY